MRLTRASITLLALALALGCGKKPDAAPTGADPGAAVPSIPGGPPTPPTAPTIPVVPTKPSIPDSYGDPLPTGAVLRLGTERGKPENGWAVMIALPRSNRILHSERNIEHFTLYAPEWV